VAPVRLTVRVTPRAAREGVARDADGTVRVRVTAAPVDGAANAAVVRALASALDLPARDVTLVAGATGRVKQFEVPLSEGGLDRRLPRQAAP
jgi:uncharacterized protein YggU (UPF0235/DUF167 family)